MNKFVHSIKRLANGLVLLVSASACFAQAPTIANPGAASNGRLDIVVLPSGLPFVAFQDGSNIKAMACADSECTSATSVTTIASLTSSRVRATVGSDGLPVVSISIINNGLRVVKCQNAQCTLSSTAILESTNLGGTDHAIVIPADGRPLIAYYDAINFDLKYVRCGDAACSSGNQFAVVDSDGVVGRAPSIALVGSLPQIAYLGVGGLKLAICASLDCTAGTAFKPLSSDSPISSSILAGRDGAALIAYEADAAVDSLKLAKCSNVGCSTAAVQTIDALTAGAVGSGVGTGVQLRAGADGLPVMSYFDKSVGTVKLARCTKQDCSTTTLTTVHAPTSNIIANGSTQAALTISAKGTPQLAYAQQLIPAGLTVHSCNTRSCQ